MGIGGERRDHPACWAVFANHVRIVPKVSSPPLIIRSPIPSQSCDSGVPIPSISCDSGVPIPSISCDSGVPIPSHIM
ncbi:unnamed protein product [Staurois parvus]|uniref:Uncharacterized protein n=1 Tax=Staurois parvus TaxID=386267 RepID=A0ABN9D1N2_9NEOB|nr:unnamed protein product [Staurois parvus]